MITLGLESGDGSCRLTFLFYKGCDGPFQPAQASFVALRGRVSHKGVPRGLMSVVMAMQIGLLCHRTSSPCVLKQKPLTPGRTLELSHVAEVSSRGTRMSAALLGIQGCAPGL